MTKVWIKRIKSLNKIRTEVWIKNEKKGKDEKNKDDKAKG